MPLFEPRGVNAALLVWAAVLLLAPVLSTVAAETHESGVQLHARSNPQAPDLSCPAPAAAPPTTSSRTRRPHAPPGVMPGSADLDMLPAMVSVPQEPISPDLLEGFRLPKAGSGRVLRVGFWGDSHLAAAFLNEELARILRARKLEVASTYLPPTVGRPGVRLPLRKHCVSARWDFQPAYLASAPGQRTGPALATLQASTRGEFLWLDLRDQRKQATVKHVRIFHQPSSRGAVVTVSMDGGRAYRIRIPKGQEAAYPESIQITASQHVSTLKIQVAGGEFQLQGIQLIRDDRPQVEMDLFAFPSATIRAWAMLDPVYLQGSLADAPYDAVVLEYGTNEGNVDPFDAKRYADTLEAALSGVRQVFPAASCLLMGPTDRGRLLPAGRGAMSREARSEQLLHHSRIHQSIVAIQRRAAARHGCAHWDWQAYMGGMGGAYRWALAKPALAARDLIHLTPAGYRQTAGALAKLLGWDPVPAPAIPFEPTPPRSSVASSKLVAASSGEEKNEWTPHSD